MNRGTFALFAVCLACQPFDRHDGRLVIAMERVPSEVDTIEVTVRAGGRVSSERMPRPFDDRITTFSAVPAGPASVDLELFAGSRLIDSRFGLAADIVEGETFTLTVNFESGPDFTIELPDGEPHRLFGGSTIVVEIHLANSDLMVRMQGTANGEPISINPFSRGWFTTIDASLAGDVLPAEILLEITACLVDENECITKRRTIEVTRAPWRIGIADETLSRPKRWNDRIVLADGAGAIHAVTSTEGEYAELPIFLETAVAEDTALVNDTLHVTARDGRLFTVDLETRAVSSKEIGATSAPIAGPNEVVVAAGSDLIALSDNRVIGSLPRTVRAPPLVDAEGIVAADVLGNVLALDASGAVRFIASAGSPVYAQPVRYRGRVVIATNFGALLQLDPSSGVEIVPRIELGRNVAYAPVVIGERMIIAADDRVLFVEDDRVAAEVRVESTITSAPVAWNEGVIVGLRSGLVRRVSVEGSRPIERVSGAALGLLVIERLGSERGAGIVAVGSRGDFAMLEVEGSF